MSFITAYENIVETAINNNPVNEDDYIGNDGLVYCGKCHTPKQSWAPLPLSEKKWAAPIPCACMEIKFRKIDELKKHEENEIRRCRCFKTSEMAEWRFANDDGNSDSHAMQIAQNYVDNFEKMNQNGIGLFIHGDVGVGKSFMAACIANALIDKGVNPYMTDFTTIISDLWNCNERTAYYNSLNDTPLLIIDDLGRENGSPYNNNIIASVLELRCRSKRPLILTSNLSPESLMKDCIIDLKRVYSRIFELCLPVEFKGIDRRQTKMLFNQAIYSDLLGL